MNQQGHGIVMYGICFIVLLWFVLGLLYEGDREGARERNIKKSAFIRIILSYNMARILLICI